MDMKQLIKIWGIAILISAIFGGISGLIGFDQLGIYPLLLFTVTYIPAGVLAAFWNKKAPYSAAYFIGLTLAVSNMLFAIFVFGINVWVDSESTFMSLTLGGGACLLASVLTVHLTPAIGRLSS